MGQQGDRGDGLLHGVLGLALEAPRAVALARAATRQWRRLRAGHTAPRQAAAGVIMEDLHRDILTFLREQRAPRVRQLPEGARVLTYARVAPAEAEPGALAAQVARCRVFSDTLKGSSAVLAV